MTGDGFQTPASPLKGGCCSPGHVGCQDERWRSSRVHEKFRCDAGLAEEAKVEACGSWYMRSQGKLVGLERGVLGRGGGRRGTGRRDSCIADGEREQGSAVQGVKEKKCFVLVVGKVKEPGE
mmetsp:Transcript_33918/g.76264  ORF Transcript_33918/g.76264 Transcript_33918/m.76264 type:complete len:122 (+) Transcript_33918:420-785(+)